MALKFVGASSQFLDLGTCPGLNITGNITILGWINTTTTGVQQRILSVDQKGSPFFGYALGSGYNGNGTLNYYSNTIGSWTAATAIHNDGRWHAIGVTINGTGAGAGTFWLDGATNGTWSQTAPSSVVGSNKCFGARDGGTTPFLTALLARWGVWNRALTREEVLQHASGMPVEMISPGNLVGGWEMEGPGGPVFDLSGKWSNGVPTGITYSDGPPFLAPRGRTISAFY